MITARQIKALQKLPRKARLARLAKIDWTIDRKTGRSNSSSEFIRLREEIRRLILDSGSPLLRGDARQVAGLIMAQLAHVHGMAPKRKRAKLEAEPT